MIFPERIKQLRCLHQLTQAAMSERLNMDQSTYSRYEKGITIPAAPLLLQISEEFKVPIEWLLKEDTPPPAKYFPRR